MGAEMCIRDSSKIVPKSMPKRLQNRLRLGYPLGAPKNTIFDVQTSPRWLPKVSNFFENRLQLVAMTVFGPRCLLEASKSLPRASQEPSQSPQEALHSLQEPPVRPPRGLQEPALQTFLHSGLARIDKQILERMTITAFEDQTNSLPFFCANHSAIESIG